MKQIGNKRWFCLGRFGFFVGRDRYYLLGIAMTEFAKPDSTTQIRSIYISLDTGWHRQLPLAQWVWDPEWNYGHGHLWRLWMEVFL